MGQRVEDLKWECKSHWVGNVAAAAAAHIHSVNTGCFIVWTALGPVSRRASSTLTELRSCGRAKNGSRLRRVNRVVSVFQLLTYCDIKKNNLDRVTKKIKLRKSDAEFTPKSEPAIQLPAAGETVCP